MFRQWTHSIIFPLCFASVVACSQQSRESNPNITAAELSNIVTDALNDENLGDPNGSKVLMHAHTVIQDLRGTSVYFNDGPRKGASMKVAFSYNPKQLGFLLPADVLKKGSVVGVRVLFIDHNRDHLDYLLVGILQSPTADDASDAQFKYYPFEGTGVISNHEFRMPFQGADGSQYTLRSRDVRGDSLRATIQLEVLAATQSAPIAKFNSLAGFR